MRGVDPQHGVVLVAAGAVAGITSAVGLQEFGQTALEANLHDSVWLEAKARAHDAVLAAAVGRATVVPFRFGAIYESAEHVTDMLAARSELAETLQRLADKLELGVTAYLDPRRLHDRLRDERGLGETAEESGRAYMQRRQLEREVADAAGAFAAECAERLHEELQRHALDGRANPVRPSDADDPDMVLNGAYLIRAGTEEAFRASVGELGERYEPDGVTLAVTGPWPPYNFVDEGLS